MVGAMPQPPDRIPEREHLLKEPLLTELVAGLDGWSSDGKRLEKTFTLNGWKAAIRFVNGIADAATAADHHPDLHVERYKHVRVVLTTHVSGGISEADVDLANAIDSLVPQAKT